MNLVLIYIDIDVDDVVLIYIFSLKGDEKRVFLMGVEVRVVLIFSKEGVDVEMGVKNDVW